MSVNSKFLEKIQAGIEIRKKVDFQILVWGSGESDELAFSKRKKMVRILSEHFGEGNVIMSEAPELKSFREQYGDIVAESVEVDAADFIVILDTSLGSHVEAQEYYYKIGNKSTVLCSDKYAKAKSFASNLQYKITLNYFKQDEYEKCNLINSVTAEDLFEHCFKRACILRELKFDKLNGNI